MTVLFLVLLAWLVSLTRVKTAVNNDAVLKVNLSLPADAQHILCSPNTAEIHSLMQRTLAYLERPRPDLRFYRSASEAEDDYLNMTTSAHAANRRVIGVDFPESAGSSSIRYSIRFRAHDLADTEIFFNHACE